MANAELGRIAGALRGADPPDAVLLDRFRQARDEEAFAELVRRHGRTVLAACRHVLTDPGAIDDSFQAAFVVLFRRAAAVDAATLGSWLYAVAHRVAVKARSDAARRGDREGAAAARRSERVEPPDPSWREAVAVLHEELDRLPDTYRRALLLCDLAGRSRDEAAAEQGVSAGVVKGRLERGAELLARRLARRGIAPSVTLLAAVTGNSAGAGGPPPDLIERTGRAVSGGASPAVAALARGVLAMRSVVKVMLACTVLAAGLAAVGFAVSRAGHSTNPPPVTADPTTTQAADKKTTDTDRLQGRWTLVDADDSDGLSKKLGFVPHVMVVKGDEMWTETKAGGVEESGVFKLDPDKNPKQLEYRIGGKGKDGRDRLGVYALDGDKLTICFSSVVPTTEELRPTDFTIKSGTGRILLVYRREKPDPATDAKEAVTTFYRNLAAGKAKESAAPFLSPAVVTSGFFRGAAYKPEGWQKKPAEYLAMHGDQPKYLPLDAVAVELVHPGLAGARVTFRSGGVKGYAVVTLSAEVKGWKIVSLFEETHFVW